MAYGDFTNLARRTFADNVWRDKAYDIAKNPKYDWYQRVLTSMVYKCFDKKSSGSGIKNESTFNKELAAELHKPITGYVSISAFAILVRIPVGITSSPIALKICVITTEMKKHKPTNKKNKKKHDKTVLLAKSKLNSIELLISKILIDSFISHDEFVSVNIVLKELYDVKEEIKNSNGK